MLQIHELDDPIKMCINFAGNFFVVALAVTTYAMQHFYPHLSTKFLLKQCKMWGTIFGSRFSWAGKSLHMARRIQFQVLSKIVSCHLLHFAMKTTLGAVLSLSLAEVSRKNIWTDITPEWQQTALQCNTLNKQNYYELKGKLTKTNTKCRRGKAAKGDDVCCAALTQQLSHTDDALGVYFIFIINYKV